MIRLFLSKLILPAIFLLFFFGACKKSKFDKEKQIVPYGKLIAKPVVLVQGDKMTIGLKNSVSYSAMTLTGKDSILMALNFFFSPGDFGNADIALLDGSKNAKYGWKNLRHLAKPEGATSLMLPSLLNINDKLLILVSLVKLSSSSSYLVCNKSTDGGKTWSENKAMTSSDLYLVPGNNRLIFNNGRILFPVSYIKGEVYANYNTAAIKMIYSDDLGETWQESNSFRTNTSLLEPGAFIADDSGNSIFLNIRSYEGTTFMIKSNDNGSTFESQLYDLGLPSSEAPSTICKVGKNMLLASWSYHLNSKKGDRNNREQLAIAYSKDQGKTWEGAKFVESDDRYNFSYPTIVVAGEEIIMTYYKSPKNTNYQATVVNRILLKNIVAQE
jgi:hypothetical protein